MTLFQALILALVEGLTEYLPISSTGHLIITSALLGIGEQSFTKDFTVIVQFGAILSVLVLYWRRFVTSVDIYKKLLVAFLPAAVVGLAIKDHVDALLSSVTTVAVALIVGGIILVFVDRWFARQEAELAERESGSIEGLNYKQAVGIGFFQCLAFIPGVSRSAASIIGGLNLKLTRKAAAEFSFLLAVPTLTAATALKVLKILPTIEANQISIILWGNVASFIVGTITIKAFLEYLTRYGFLAFGIYRIIVGVLLLVLMTYGYDLKVL